MPRLQLAASTAWTEPAGKSGVRCTVTFTRNESSQVISLSQRTQTSYAASAAGRSPVNRGENCQPRGVGPRSSYSRVPVQPLAAEALASIVTGAPRQVV